MVSVKRVGIHHISTFEGVTSTTTRVIPISVKMAFFWDFKNVTNF